MRSLNNSKQRDAIMQFLCTRKDHPTADVVYTEVRKTIPNISLGTVYRNLNLLAETGKILRLSTENVEHYDADTHPHLHFFCKTCGSVEDIMIDNPSLLSELEKAVENSFKGTIFSSSVNYYGMCEKCSFLHKSCDE